MEFELEIKLEEDDIYVPEGEPESVYCPFCYETIYVPMDKNPVYGIYGHFGGCEVRDNVKETAEMVAERMVSIGD